MQTTPSPEPTSPSLSSKLQSTIQERIVRREILPGSRLVERALCQEFGVSRSVVRESIVRLANCGLVDITPDAGATVSALTESRVVDAYLFREGVETIAAEQCALRMNREQVEQLEELAHRFAAEYDARCAGQPHQLESLDAAFHQMIVDGSRNELLRRAWDTAMLHCFRGGKISPEELTQESRVASVDDHLVIAAAIKAGAAEEAGAKMKLHLQHGRSLFIHYARRKAPATLGAPIAEPLHSLQKL